MGEKLDTLGSNTLSGGTLIPETPSICYVVLLNSSLMRGRILASFAPAVLNPLTSYLTAE